jgi:hypothetical protein
VVEEQSQTVDAFSNETGDCEERLNITEDQMQEEMEYFSRKLEPSNLQNALWIYGNLTNQSSSFSGRPLVHTWELYDKAFHFPRVRKYEFVLKNMDMLQHFEDNLNTNISNEKNLQNFLRVAATVRKNFNDKFGGDGGFEDPATIDPYEEKDPNWSGI